MSATGRVRRCSRRLLSGRETACDIAALQKHRLTISVSRRAGLYRFVKAVDVGLLYTDGMLTRLKKPPGKQGQDHGISPVGQRILAVKHRSRLRSDGHLH